MNDDELKSQLRRGWRSADAADTPPDFDSMWNAATAQASGRHRYRALAAAVAAIAAAVLVSVVLLPEEIPNNDAWVADINESLLNSTAWWAPSDVLLSADDHEIYTTLPTLIESTDLEIETLL